MVLHAACSINYLLDDDVITVNDPKNFLKEYQDHDTKSGNVCLVSFLPDCLTLHVPWLTSTQRNFCSNCGRCVRFLIRPRFFVA